jgi:hypothetical protein
MNEYVYNRFQGSRPSEGESKKGFFLREQEKERRKRSGDASGSNNRYASLLEEHPGNWECPSQSCSMVNFAHRSQCFKCNFSKPKQTNLPAADRVKAGRQYNARLKADVYARTEYMKPPSWWDKIGRIKGVWLTKIEQTENSCTGTLEFDHAGQLRQILPEIKAQRTEGARFVFPPSLSGHQRKVGCVLFTLRVSNCFISAANPLECA